MMMLQPSRLSRMEPAKVMHTGHIRGPRYGPSEAKLPRACFFLAYFGTPEPHFAHYLLQPLLAKLQQGVHKASAPASEHRGSFHQCSRAHSSLR